MNLKPIDLATVGLGIAAIVASVLLPATSVYLLPTGIGLIALILKRPSEMLANDKENK